MNTLEYTLRRSRILPLLLIACTALTVSANPGDEDIPVAPVDATTYGAWTNAYSLSNSEVTVVIVPDIGRVVFLGKKDGKNLLRSDKNLAGQLPDPETTDWLNYGGDWIWPVAQSRWETFQEGNWPPSRLLDGRPWEGSAWKTADGSLCCLITQTYGEPLHIEARRLFRLATNGAVVVVQQKIERTADSDIPVTLWNISQIGEAERVVLPEGSKDEAGEAGLRPMMFDEPPPEALIRCEGHAVYLTEEGGEAKLCTDAVPAWIAAQKGDMLIIEKAVEPDPEGDYPDGGCSVEMYSNSGLGYSEIETLSTERDLEKGELLQNTLTIELRKLPEKRMEPCAVAAEAAPERD
jgi:hypothetical protein